MFRDLSPLREKPLTDQPNPLHCVPAIWADPYTKLLLLYFNLMDWTSPIQSKAGSYILTCMFTNQPEQLQNYQSEQRELGSLHLHEIRPTRNRKRAFFSIWQPPLCLPGGHFQSFQTVSTELFHWSSFTWIKFLPSQHHKLGILLALDWWQQPFWYHAKFKERCKGLVARHWSLTEKYWLWSKTDFNSHLHLITIF